MSLENGEKHSVDQPIESNYDANKKSRITYSREFLLSLGGLDVCQKLPSEFDNSLLSEFEDASLERQRVPGSFSSHGFRRNEYGSSPPTRGDSSGYNRGVHGRWDSRSSGRSDKDSEQSDADSDSGRRPVYQPRRGWHPPEHDGLLGSGSFPRPSGYGPGASAAKFRANDHYQLNRSSEPYHPPRTYKAIPHARREANDSYNDETFGSSEYTSEDKAEEERKRRASFELMRKEQQKAFQERQRINVDKRKDEFDITTLLDDPGDEKRLVREAKESNEAALPQTTNGDLSKPSSTHQIMGPRPLVPPGFAGAVPDKKLQSAEVKTSAPEDSKSYARDSNPLSNYSNTHLEKHGADEVGSTAKQDNSTTIQNLAFDDSEKNLDISSKNIGKKNILAAFNLPETLESSDISEIVKLDFEKAAGNNTVGSGSHSTTILEKLFGGALTLEAADSSTSLEQKDGQGDDAWSPHTRTNQSSKFARWFLEDDKQSDDLVPGGSKDLLSLIVAGEKNESSTFDVQPSEQPWPDGLFSATQSADGHITSNVNSTTDKKPEKQFSNSKSEAVSTVLTCEDLENSILSEISESGSKMQPSPLDWGVNGTVAEQPRADVDDRASQQLLSLLQKGPGQKDAGLFFNLDVKASEEPYNTDFEETRMMLHNSEEVNKETAAHAGRSLTLETLFGTAFMQELQSVGAPVSAQRNLGLGGSARIETIDETVLSSGGSEMISGRTSHENVALPSNHKQHSNLDKMDGHFLGIDVAQNQTDTDQLKPEAGPKLVDFNRPADIWLPEEDSLIAAGDPLNSQGYLPGRGPAKVEPFTSQNIPTAPVNIVDKLTALNGLFKEENFARGGQPPFHQIPYDKRDSDIPLQNLHIQSSSSQLHPHQLNHMGSLFHPLDSHSGQKNPQMKLMPPEGILHHDSQPNHQFPLDMIHPPVHRPNTGFTGFDPPNHHPLFQQLHMSGSLPPPQQFQGFPRGSQIPHPNNQMPAFVQDPNAMQGFPFGLRQPNFGGLAMVPPASEIGGGNSEAEALQRLIEMELRPNAKQMNPFPTVGHSQGVFGHELDMGFRYR